MKKVLVYVDGDNLCKEEAETLLNKIAKEHGSNNLIIGKVYGDSERVLSVIRVGYDFGYEFIDTSHITSNQKNVTDMKIVVDCITDVCAIHDDIKCVILLSKDCDFMPLYFKLKWRGIETTMPLYVNRDEGKTVNDLGTKLTEIGYDPMRNGMEALDNQFGSLCELIGDEFSENLISQYLARKKRKLISAISVMMDKNSINELSEIPVDKLSFADILRHSNGQDKALLKIYTLKMYGRTYKETEGRYFLRQYKINNQIA